MKIIKPANNGRTGILNNSMRAAAGTLSAFWERLFPDRQYEIKFLIALLLCVAGMSLTVTAATAIFDKGPGKNGKILASPAALGPGSLDATFSQDGKLYDFFIHGSGAQIRSTALQPDGKIVVTGEYLFGLFKSCAVSRYNPNGSPDLTFDGDGVVTIPSGLPFRCNAVAVQPDGKIVAAGSKQDNIFNNTYSTYGKSFALVRLNPNGSLDTSFDSDGFVFTYMGDTLGDTAYAVAIQPDGKIVAVGVSDESDFAAVRYNVNGSLDTSFDSDGIATVSLTSSSDKAFAMALQPDGKIVAAGTTNYTGSSHFGLARFNANGSIDTSFGTNGRVITSIGNTVDYLNGVAIQADGKIVAVGISVISNFHPTTPMSQNEFSLVRYNTDGSLDTSFDSDGKVITPLPNTDESANAVAIQADGKIVIAGLTEPIASSSYEDFALVRYNINGSPDTSFDSDGIVVTRAGSGDSAADSIVIQPDGKIIAGGFTPLDFILARYNTDGSLDTSFSTSGKRERWVSFEYCSARAMAIQPDGKLIAAGTAGKSPAGAFAVARYNPDGSPDISFDSDGKVVTPISSEDDIARAVALQADGKIVVAGSNGFSGNSDFNVVRYNADGSLDTSFDSDGKVITSIGDADLVTALAIQADGKIVAGGYSNGDFTLVRYNTNGSLDASFGVGGKVVTNVAMNDSDGISALAIQPDGKIIAAGETSDNPAKFFALVRYNPDGSLDTSFDTDGIVTTSLSSTGDYATAVALQPDGKIVAAGNANAFSLNARDFAVVRYNPDGSLDTSFDSDGKVITPLTNGGDEANAVAIQANGKIVVGGKAGANFGVSISNDFALVRYNTDGSLDNTFSDDGKATFDFWGTSNDVLYGMALDSAGRAVLVGESNQLFVTARVNLANPKTTFDYDGDGRTDVSVFRPSDGNWYLLQSQNGLSVQNFGLNGDVITPGDFDGDGKTDLAIFRPSNGTWWYASSLNGGFYVVGFGLKGDIPLAEDFNGDGRADFVIYRPSNSTWYRLSSTGQYSPLVFGTAGDIPLVADMDGDGKADPTIYRPSTGTWWYASSLNGGFYALQWGSAADIPVPGDYDGDGKTDPAYFRPSNGAWYVAYSSTGYSTFMVTSWGISGDRPTAADYDGDGKTDPAIYRPSNGMWFILQSTGGPTGVNFGLSGDKATPGAFIY